MAPSVATTRTGQWVYRGAQSTEYGREADLVDVNDDFVVAEDVDCLVVVDAADKKVVHGNFGGGVGGGIVVVWVGLSYSGFAGVVVVVVEDVPTGVGRERVSLCEDKGGGGGGGGGRGGGSGKDEAPIGRAVVVNGAVVVVGGVLKKSMADDDDDDDGIPTLGGGGKGGIDGDMTMLLLLLLFPVLMVEEEEAAAVLGRLKLVLP